MVTDLILGTAGHIDHGKTSLVAALTGTNTDRLPEEKRRGITIELGFAELEIGEFRFGIVDVPGHERFVRNMLAGATGIDVAMLVVAADDSVKPQTREHFEVLKLLGLPTGLIALSKCDLADPAWIELVEEEIRELVADSFLEGTPLIRTSAATGAGLDELRQALAEAGQIAAQSPRRQRVAGPFRMAIDRTFTIAGHGTVVTGSVASGRAHVGDELVIEPGAVAVRVRGLQNHDRAAEEIERGQRAALNLAGIHHDAVTRGQEVAASDHLRPSRRISASLRALGSLSRPLKNRMRVRCHLGTAEVLASLMLLEQDQLAAGDTAFAQLFLREPVVGTWEQGFVIRGESPVTTLGGGQVLDSNAVRIRRFDEGVIVRLRDLQSDDPLTRAAAAIYLRGVEPWRSSDLPRLAGIPDPEQTVETLIDRGELVRLRVSPQRTQIVHREILSRLVESITRTLERMHEQSPLELNLQRSRLARRLRHECNAAVFDAVCTSMRDEGILTLSDHTIGLANRGATLSDNEQRLLEQIVTTFEKAGYQPPTVEEVASGVAKNQAVVPQLVDLAADTGRLVKVSPEYFLHAEVERRLRDTIAQRLTKGDGLTVSQIREMLSTSRKYAVPFCEYLDQIGLTRRQGDLRVLASADAQAAG